MSKSLSPNIILVRSHSATSLSPFSPGHDSTKPESDSFSNNQPKTPTFDKAYCSLDNLDYRKDSLDLPNIIITCVPEKRLQGLQSTAGETDHNDAEIVRDRTDSLEFRKSAEYSANTRPHSEGNGLKIETKMNSLPKIEPFDEQFDEFSILVATSPQKLREPDENLNDESPQMLKPKSFLVVQTKTLTPYLSNVVKTSPFMKEHSYSQDRSSRLVSPIPFKDTDISRTEDTPREKVTKSQETLELLPKIQPKDILLNEDYLGKVCSFLEYGDISSLMNMYSEYSIETRWRKFFKNQLLGHFISEPHKEQQYLFWASAVAYHNKSLEHSDWKKYSMMSCDAVEDICKDLDRTLPEYEIFQTEEGRNPLLKVLMALCNTYPEMGYVQGLNSLVGVTLFYLNEEESYALMRYLLEDLRAKKIFYPNFEGLAILNYQLEAYLEHYLPEVMRLFKENSMAISYYTYSWFITLFADNLKIANVVKLWNFFFVKGFPFLVQFALALFSIHKDELLSMDIDEVGSFIKSRLWSLDTNEENIFKEALRFKVTQKLLDELENLYITGKPKVKLVSSTKDNQKLTWERIAEKREKSRQFEASSPCSSKELKELKWHEQTLKPFLQNVINTVTFDIPGAFKHFFKKSPAKTPSPSSNTKSSEKSTDAVEEIIQLNVLQESKSDNKAKVLELTPSYKPRLFDLERPVGMTGEGSIGTMSEEDKEKENIQEESTLEKESMYVLELELSKQEDLEQNKRRSIVTRLRRNIDNKVPSKTFSELPEEEIDYSVENNKAEEGKFAFSTYKDQSLLVIKWEEVIGEKSVEVDDEVNVSKDEEENVHIKQQKFAEVLKPSMKQDEDQYHSDTDCTHLDDEVPILFGDETPTRYLGEISPINHSKSWPENRL